MKASRVVELVLEDIRNSKTVDLINYTCVRNLIKWGEKNPEQEWWELVANTINIDADKFQKDYAPNIWKLVRLFWARREELNRIQSAYWAGIVNPRVNSDWKIELKNMDGENG
jgi:hypothetical protein